MEGWLNKTGWTKLCLRSNKDINGTAPSGNEFVIVYASEQGSGYQPKLVINYRNQSKIKNTGSTNIKGYLLIQIQYYNDSSWYVANDVIDETSPRTITTGNGKNTRAPEKRSDECRTDRIISLQNNK